MALARKGSDVVVESEPGRAKQMNKGAAVANGDVFLFLHADTVLPENAVELVTSVDPGKPFWGRFDVRLSGDRVIFRLVEFMVNLRSRLSSIATGDQALFISSALFHAVGGYPEIALMEDIAISKSLRRERKPVNLKATVTTSSRRWEKRGVAKTIVLMWKLRLYYFFGMSPDKLVRMYR
jgi:rSAM/selenodomain-associated transferase 2